MKLTRETITTDHVVPLSERGYDKRKNVVPCCYLCNQAKGRMNPTLFKSLMKEAKAAGQVPQVRARIIAERTVS